MALTQASEEGLNISNAGTNGQFLQKQSGNAGGLTWASVSNDKIEEGDSSIEIVDSGSGGYASLKFDDQEKIRINAGGIDLADGASLHIGSLSGASTTGFAMRSVSNSNEIYTLSSFALKIQAANQVGQTETMATFTPAGSAALYFDNAKKAETVTGGFTVTGTCTATSFAGDGSNLTGISTGVTSDGQNNTVAGTNAGDSFDGTNATDNTLFGRDAGTAISTGDDNSAFGGKALQATTTGGANTAVGYYSLYTNTTSEHNTAVGVNSLRTNDGGDGNVAVGHGALYSNTTANENVAIGKNAMYANTEGHSNVAVGYNALDANTTGDKHTAVGKLALSAVETANENTAVGYYALAGNTTGQYNTGIGVEAGITNTTGSYNTSVGWKALNVGTGASCTAVGAEAGLSITAGNNCTYLGSSAGRYATGSQNVAIGSESMEGASGTNSGSESVIIGHQAGHTTTSGGKNTYVGYQAGYSNTSHSNVIAIGYKASENIVTGTSIAIGSEAGNDHTTCHTNICIGDNTDKDSGNNSGGHTATIIGHNSKRSGGTFNEGVYGNSATGLGSNKLLLGWSNVYHSGNNADFSTTSDQRIKKNIVNNNTGLSVINNIQVKNFEYKTKEEVKEAFPSFTDTQVESSVVEKSGTQLGLIAQELATVLPNCVSENDHGIKSVERDELFWYMLNAIKELSAKVTALESA